MDNSNHIIKLSSSELAIREDSLITRGLELLQTKKSILIYFSENAMCNLLDRILYDDYSIYETNKKEELSIILNAHTIDVLITDVRCFGESWTTEIRSIKHSYPNIKILNLSYYNDISLMIDLININYSGIVIDGMLQMPFEPNILREKIQSILSAPDTVKQKKQSRRKMLISDDEISVINIYLRLIKTLSISVEIDWTIDSIETKKIIESDPNKYDLFTTDNRKPHICGSELARLVRIISPKTKILICSAYLDTNLSKEILENELADYYLYKPDIKENYLHVISNLLDL